VAGLGITLLGTRLFGQAFITEPERVQSVGREIASYQVPPGYEEVLAMKMLGAEVVTIGPSDADADFVMIMLMQFPGGMEISQAEMERQLEQALARQVGWGNADMQMVGHEETRIKGETVDLTVREGAREDGERLRQISGVFPGNQGPAILLIVGEVAAWDRETVNQFIASIE
jgi:hypothetical protein